MTKDSQQPLNPAEPVSPLPSAAVPAESDPKGDISPEGNLPKTPEGIARSLAAFRRDLPQLLGEHAGEWVAYHHDERVGFDKSKTELYRRCLDRGMNRGEFVVEFVESEDSHVALPTMLEDRS